MSEKYDQIKEKAHTVGLIARVIPANWEIKDFKYYLTGRGYKMQFQHRYPSHVWIILELMNNDKIDFFKNLDELSFQVNHEFEKRKTQYFVAPAMTTGKNTTLFRKIKMKKR